MRGDEVVSLGWCFWHKSCFGCLICGTRMSVPVGDDVTERKAVGMGVELDEIPLCTVCSVELSGESEASVLGRGLENISRFDGGLTRERLQRWSEVNDGNAETLVQARKPSDRRSLTKSERGCQRCSVGFAPCIVHKTNCWIASIGTS